MTGFTQHFVGVGEGPVGVGVFAAGLVGLTGFGVFVGDFTTTSRLVDVGVMLCSGVNVELGGSVDVGVNGSSPSKLRAVAVGTGEPIAILISSDLSSASSGDKPRS